MYVPSDKLSQKLEQASQISKATDQDGFRYFIKKRVGCFTRRRGQHSRGGGHYSRGATISIIGAIRPHPNSVFGD